MTGSEGRAMLQQDTLFSARDVNPFAEILLSEQ